MNQHHFSAPLASCDWPRGFEKKHKVKTRYMATMQERAELHKTIWKIANDLRGSVDGWEFKAYVTGGQSLCDSPSVTFFGIIAKHTNKEQAILVCPTLMHLHILFQFPPSLSSAASSRSSTRSRHLSRTWKRSWSSARSNMNITGINCWRLNRK